MNTDEYGKNLDDAGKKTSEFGTKLKNGLKTAAKVGVAALSAAATGVVALTKASVDNYAEYEQLVGGVETLFKNSSDTVMKYAENAYKTAGLSANEYMETVTSFSASLLQSLGGDTEKAAKAADKAITDMSDNANKMGTSMEMIQNAYQGFAKQNYTMLDNLKLGYGGTKEEMQRLLDDAAKLSGQKFDISSYADIVDAIHIVQTEMGITGTTAKEAATTISGSAGMMKSAWQNFMTGIADDSADFGQLTDSLVSSVSTFASNIIPRVQTALGGVVNMISGLAPIISEKLPELVSALLPSVIEGATNIISAVVAVLPELLTSVVTAISEQAPLIIQSGLDMLLLLGQSLIENAPILITAISQIISDMGTWIAEYASVLMTSAIDLLMALATGFSQNLPTIIPELTNLIIEIADVLTSPDNLSTFIDAALAIILALADGLVDAIPQLIPAVPVIIVNLVDAIIQNLPKIIASSNQIIRALAKGMIDNIPIVVSAIGDIVKGIVDAFIENWDYIKTSGKDMIDNFIAGIKERWAALKSTVSDTAQIVKDFLGFSEPDKGPLSDFHTYAPDMMDLFAEGIEKNSKKVLEKVEKLAQKIKDKLGEIQSYFDTTIDIAEMEYQLWEMTEGIDATETEKAAKKLEMLNQQLADQKEVVEASNIAYQEMVKLYGEGSAEANEYKKTLLEEQIEYQKLSNELNETNSNYKELTKSQRTWATVAVEAVRTVSTAILESTQSSDNAVQKQQEKAVSDLNGNIGELVSLFKSGKAKTSVSNAREMRGVSYG